MSATFKLRRDAKFHDGTPVTANDVKWSFDRAVTVGGFPTFQMKAGSLEKPEQFVAVDDHTFRIDFLRKDKLTLPDLGVPVPVDHQFRAGEKTRHRQRSVGDGMAENQRSRRRRLPRREMDARAGGGLRALRRLEIRQPLPGLQRVIWRTMPSAGNRRALLERGDADISFDLPPKDVAELAKEGKLKVVGTPIENAIQLYRHAGDKTAVRQRQGAAGGRLRDAVPENHGRGDVRSRKADVRRAARGHRAGVAAAAPLYDRPRQGEAAIG